MAKIWSADNPKAGLMAQKRALIVEAASRAFLDAGYAATSVNQIAADAGVSIKTLYRHYESKDELFSAVMQAACGRSPDHDAGDQVEEPPAWYALPPVEALPLAGEDYLRHALAPEQLALYRVVARDAHRFPELGRRYHEATIGTRDAVFAGYLDLWAGPSGWTIRDKHKAAQMFAGLLKAPVFDRALLGLGQPSDAEITRLAQDAADNIRLLFQEGRL